MTDGDAYQNEMGFLRPNDIDDSEFRAFVEEVRSAYRHAPDPFVESRHITAIVKQSQRTLAEPALLDRNPDARPLKLIARIAIAAAAFGLLTTGLAIAGVGLPILPDPAPERAREAVATPNDQSDHETNSPSVDQLPENASDTAVGVVSTIEANLQMLQSDQMSGCEFGAMVSAAARGTEPASSHCPDKGTVEEESEQGSEVAERVLAVIDANLPQLQKGEISGCEFGALVSAAARGVEPETSRCSTPDDAASVSAPAMEGKGAESSAKGRARADAARTAGQGNGEEASDAKGNGDGSGAGASDAGQATVDEGKANGGGNGEAASAAGQDTADEAQSQGQANGEEASGGKANPGGPPN
jgi:hypothetical protein